jgi:hypothetical protein
MISNQTKTVNMTRDKNKRSNGAPQAPAIIPIVKIVATACHDARRAASALGTSARPGLRRFRARYRLMTSAPWLHVLPAVTALHRDGIAPSPVPPTTSAPLSLPPTVPAASFDLDSRARRRLATLDHALLIPER